MSLALEEWLREHKQQLSRNRRWQNRDTSIDRNRRPRGETADRVTEPVIEQSNGDNQ